MKNFRRIYEVQTASRLKEIIKPPTRQKFASSLEKNFSYGDIQEYTPICFPSASKMQFLGV